LGLVFLKNYYTVKYFIWTFIFIKTNCENIGVWCKQA
jgi:hypothetical protein